MTSSISEKLNMIYRGLIHMIIVCDTSPCQIGLLGAAPAAIAAPLTLLAHDLREVKLSMAEAGSGMISYRLEVTADRSPCYVSSDGRLRLSDGYEQE